jgi:hypothetical protein
MASFLGNRQSVENYDTVAVPQSLQGNDSPMAMRGKVRQVSVPNLNGDQKGSGKLRFVLPNNNVSISRRSMFIRARVSISYSATLPIYDNINRSVFFQGPGLGSPGSASEYAALLATTTATSIASGASTPSLGNAYSLIQRSTIYSGSSVVDMVDYVCDLMSGLILPHSTNINWLRYDGTSLIGIACPPMRSTSATTGGFVYWDLCIPVPHSCFNTERDFPLYLLSQSNPLSLEIDLTPFNRAIGYGVTYVPTPLDYTISRAALCYESVELPPEFIEAQRLQTKKIPFVIPQLSYMISQMPISALVNYNCTLNMSSLRAVYILPYNNTTYNPSYVTNNAAFAYQRLASDVAVSTAVGDFQGTNVQLFCDSECINQVNLDNPTMTFAALKQAINGSITNPISSVANQATYKVCHFAIGIDATAFSDGSTVMGGTPVKQAQIVLTNFIASATTGAYLANVIFAYDSLLIFKNGKITTKR